MRTLAITVVLASVAAGGCGDPSSAPADAAVDAAVDAVVCPTGTTGPACDVCASGYQDHDDDGTCTEACAADSCHGGGVCADDSGTLACACTTGYQGARCEACAPGYVRGPGAACVFDDRIVNGSFDAPGAPWTTTGLATIGGGHAVLPGYDPAGRGGVLRQTVMMPDLAATVPQVLELTVTAPGPDFSPSLAVLLAGAYTRLPAPTTAGAPVVRSVCLGASAYGGPITLTVVNDANHRGPLEIDDVHLRPAATGECPAPGTVVDGDFAEAGAHWVGSTGATFAPGRATLPAGTTSITGTAAFPSAGGVALEVSYALTGTLPHLAVSVGGFELAWLRPTAATTATVCVPSWARGTTQALSLIAEPGSGVATITRVALVARPACAGAWPLDLGLETGAGWDLRLDWPLADLAQLTTPPPAIVADAAGAFEGTHYLQLGIDRGCEDSGAWTTFVAAPAQQDGGLRVRHRYQLLDATPRATAALFGVDGFALQPAAAWTVASTCLFPYVYEGGRPFVVRFELHESSGFCSASRPLSTAKIDAVELVADPACL